MRRSNRSVVAAGARREAVFDALILALIVLISALPYLGSLGIYSDDWDLLYAFESAVRRGESPIWGTLDAYGVRPVQGIYLGLLFEVFGRNALGFHIVNTAVIAVSVGLFYWLLLRLGASRAQAFAAALIFSVLPQLSTVRVWFAAFQIPLSMLFMLVSAHAQLFFYHSRRALSAAIAVVAALFSVAAYEIFAPLIAGFALALLLSPRLIEPGSSRGDWRRAIAPAAVIAVVACASAVKMFSERATGVADSRHYIGVAYQLVRPDYDWRVDWGLNIFAAIHFYSWVTMRDLAAALAGLLTGRAGLAVATVAIVVALLAWWRLQTPEETAGKPMRFLLLGIATFLLGHAIFLISGAVMFAPSGIQNRVLVAAALGYAIIVVALVDLATRLVPRYRRLLFSAAVVLMSVAALTRVQAIERHWAEAPKLQQRVLNAARTDLRNVPAGATIILDGVCPYHGPAIVFETYWGISGAISFAIGQRLAADTVSSRMTITPAGLRTSIYDQPSLYRFAPSLFVYNPRLHIVTPLPDSEAAKRYFSRRDRRFACPSGFVGHGVPI